MSVPKSKRGPSGVQFVETARELEVYTIQRAAHFPKRYTFLLSNDLVSIAIRIYDNVTSANNLSNLHDDQQYATRLHHLREALSSCNSLVSQIQLCNDVFGIPYNQIEKWMELIDYEEKLLVGVLRSDAKRRKAGL